MTRLNHPSSVATLCLALVALSVVLSDGLTASEPVKARLPVVEVEEEVYSFETANNGAGPMWCFGNSCIVRHGERIFASGLHTVETAKPLNNCLPSIMVRDVDGWRSVYQAEGRTREPSPMGMFPGDKVFLSVNPTKTPHDAYSGPSQPALLQFDIDSLNDAPQRLSPKWEGQPNFSEHSYRSFAVDGNQREMILFQNVGYTHAEWSFRDRNETWAANGKLYWPRIADGRVLRICYPAVALHDRRVFVFGVTDIVEPNREWLDYKRELTGREWDYVFRRVYYTWSDDILTGEFHDWVEVSNRESTAGALFPNDLFVHPDGNISLLWSEVAVDVRLRDRFFPEAQQRHALEYAMVRDGKIMLRASLLERDEQKGGLLPGRGRFHATPDGRLWVLCYVNGVDADGTNVSRNQLLQIGPNGSLGTTTTVSLQFPLASFFTNTVRAGCLPSNWLDVFGQIGDRMRYARIHFQDRSQPE